MIKEIKSHIMAILEANKGSLERYLLNQYPLNDDLLRWQQVTLRMGQLEAFDVTHGGVAVVLYLASTTPSAHWTAGFVQEDQLFHLDFCVVPVANEEQPSSSLLDKVSDDVMLYLKNGLWALDQADFGFNNFEIALKEWPSFKKISIDRLAELGCEVGRFSFTLQTKFSASSYATHHRFEGFDLNFNFKEK